MVLEDLEIEGHKALWVGRGMSGKSWEIDEYDPNILYETLKEQIKKILTNRIKEAWENYSVYQYQVNAKPMMLKKVPVCKQFKFELYC